MDFHVDNRHVAVKHALAAILECHLGADPCAGRTVVERIDERRIAVCDKRTSHLLGPGHFAVVETWRDQQMFDARDAVQKHLLDTLQPIRVSDYDQRPYKTLTVGSAAPLSASSQAISVVTHVDTVAAPQAPALLKRLAEASRREEGNVRFDVVQHAMRANHFTVIETWQNQKALDAHAAAAHTRQYRDELHPVTGSPIDERVYKAVQ